MLIGQLRVSLVTGVLPLLLCLAAVSATAAGAADRTSPPLVVAQAEIRVSLGQAVDRVARQTGGQIISAKTITRNGRAIHRIRVLVSEGRVRVYEVDARTGNMR